MKWLLGAKRLVSPIIITLFCYYWLAYELQRENFIVIIACFGLTFGAYYLLIKRKKERKLSYFIGLGILFRLLFLLSIPVLSDDYFRFIWDGQLILNGLNPFDYLPIDVEVDFANKQKLLEQMNSPEYFTVYPPLAQLVYWLSTWLSSKDLLTNIIALRCIIVVFELGTVFLLIQLLKLMKRAKELCLLYFLNPLVIVELTGNLHFEGIMLFFFFLAIYLILIGKNWLAAIAWAIAAATKLIPIFFLPLLLRRFSLGKTAIFYTLFGFAFIICWIPFYNGELIGHFMQSVNLYYKTFEFNASIYYITRWIGYQFLDYNAIATLGPWLSRIAYLGILIILLKKPLKKFEFPFTAILIAMTWYYAFALIVHPWYICTLVGISVLTSYRYAIVWSAFIVLSYWAYQTIAFAENYWLITLEYLLVFSFFIYELRFKGKKLPIPNRHKAEGQG